MASPRETKLGKERETDRAREAPPLNQGIQITVLQILAACLRARRHQAGSVEALASVTRMS